MNEVSAVAVEVIYTNRIDTDTSDECAFAHELCLAWAAWHYGEGKLGCGTYGDVLDMPLPETKGHRDLTEEQLLAVDHAIAQLPDRMNRLVFVHYCSSEDEPMTSRYRRLGCTRLEYRVRLRAVHAALYARLMPAVERWRHLVL
jgi:hypothetical protein